jgi:hypothetical protein
VAINQPDWSLVRQTLRTLNDPAAEMPTESYDEVESSFLRIEADVERLIQEVKSLQLAERELRNALEEPAGAETQRR